MCIVPAVPTAPDETLARDGVLFRVGGLSFKPAETDEEFRQVHRLNYRTFVREIGQHADPGTGLLVDKFHDKNVYFIAARDGQVIGMLAAHDRPPFSVADRLPDAAVLDRLGGRLLEVRLLAIEPTERRKLVFAGLIWTLYQYARRCGYTHLVISGLTDRLRLYYRFGFRALGPPVRSGRAEYTPMVLSLKELPAEVWRDIAAWQQHLRRTGASAQAEPVLMTPGPVRVASHVGRAWQQSPISHRCEQFVQVFESVRQRLRELCNTADAALFCGSGTLANEVVAATLAADPQCRSGLVLVNGEFGERLVRQARRFGLSFRVLQWPWGKVWDLEQVESALRTGPGVDWIWAVHLESSTGVLNDLQTLTCLARNYGAKLCVDAVSSLGAVPLSAADLHLTSGVSGKSLSSYPGIAIVFSEPSSLEGLRADRVPEYLDLRAALDAQGPRFTFPSPQLLAFDQALQRYGTPEQQARRFAHYVELGRYVRTQLRELGLPPLADESVAAAAITSFTAPDGYSSAQFVRLCRRWGYELAGMSRYLQDRRLVQIATMGDVTIEDCERLFDCLAARLRAR